MQRTSAPRKQSRNAKTRSRPAKWPGLALTALLAVVAGCLSYVFFPGPVAVPIADLLSPLGIFAPPALGSLLGQGEVSSYPPFPAPIVTATAKASMAGRKHGPAHSPHHVSPRATSGASSADAAGLGLYDGESSPKGIETAASWLGSPSSVKYAMDFIDATDWSSIRVPGSFRMAGQPVHDGLGCPHAAVRGPSTQCATNVSDYNEVATGGADSYYKTLAQNLVSAGFGSSYIRLGWEFNDSAMGWSVCRRIGAGELVERFRSRLPEHRDQHAQRQRRELQVHLEPARRQ